MYIYIYIYSTCIFIYIYTYMAGKGTLNEDVFRIEHEDFCIAMIAISVYQKEKKGLFKWLGQVKHRSSCPS